MSPQSGPPVSYIRPVYGPADDGIIRMYAGDLSVTDDGATHLVQGDVVYRFGPRPGVYVHLASDESWLFHFGMSGDETVIAPPSGISLEPPTLSMVPVRPENAGGWAEHVPRIGNMVAGDIAAVDRLIIHVTAPLTDRPLPTCETHQGEQGQLDFTLPGWNLRLAEVDEWKQEENFPFIIEAAPDSSPITEEAVNRLEWRLFVLLSFIAGKEVGLGVVAGLDDVDQVVWGSWATTRTGSGQWRWCPDHLVNDALPDLARGFTLLSANPTLEKVVDRAINLQLTANGTQPMDARIPLACSGLELLAWAVLQTKQWLTTDAFGKLTAAQSLRLLLHWAGIPVEVPTAFVAMEARRRGLGQLDLTGPDVLNKIRNDLVHPPKRLADLEWPTGDEMEEAWRLSMDYLELVILRLLDYQGEYFPHLQLKPRWVTDTERVPWAK